MLVQVEYFFELQHFLVRPFAPQRFKVRHHKLLPSRVDVLLRHALQSCLKTLGRFKVSEKQTVLAKEEGVIMPACLSEGVEHFRPYRLVPLFIFFHLLFSDFQQKANSLHRFFSREIDDNVKGITYHTVGPRRNQKQISGPPA